MRTAFEREGDVRSVDLLGAFATLWRDRASGVVDFSGPGRTVRFDLSDGDLVAVSSSDDSFETAEILRRAEKLSADALADGRIPPGSDRARYLRDNGLLSDRDWRWGEKLRIVEILSDLIGWLDGTYRYDPTATPEPSDFPIGIHRVILELYLRSSDREFIHHSLGAPDAALERAPDFDETFASLGLTPDALAVARAIDGETTAAEISRHTPPDPFSVEKLLAALATLGLVRPEYALEDLTPVPPSPVTRAEPPPPPQPEPEPEPTVIPPSPEPPPVFEPDVSIAPPPALYAPDEADDLDLVEMPSAPAPPETQSTVELWESGPEGPLDQPLEVVEPPDFGAAPPNRLSPIWLPILLAVAVGALLLLRSREPSARPEPARPTAVVSSPTPAAALAPPPGAVPVTPTFAPPVLPTESPAVEPSSRPTPSVSKPTPSVSKPTPAFSRRTPSVPAAPSTRDAWLALAARDRRRLASDPRNRFSIQLELVCELPSLEEAWVYDRQGSMWLLTASHQGRTCFRVFWGRYRTLEEARAALGSVPRFFFTPTNRPVVVSTGGALLR
ncbi:MAG: DUF4388 domain-containing protein [Acidobacteriota bacterium]